MSALKQRVEESLAATKVKPGELRELELDGSRSESGHIEGLTDEYEALERVSLMGCNLNSLKGLPNLPNLRKLDLSDNKIADGLDTLVKHAPNITHLHLAGNKIKDVDALKPLAELKALETLELFNCDVANADDYREKVFGVLPNLFFLDGKDRDGQDAPDDEDDELYEDDLDGEEDEDDEDAEGEGEDDEEYAEEEGEEEDGEGEEEEAAAPRSRKRRHEEEEEEEDEEGDEDAEDD